MPNHDDIDKYVDANSRYGCFADLKVILDEILEEALNTVVLWQLFQILYRQMLSPNKLKVTSK